MKHLNQEVNHECLPHLRPLLLRIFSSASILVCMKSKQQIISLAYVTAGDTENIKY